MARAEARTNCSLVDSILCRLSGLLLPYRVNHLRLPNQRKDTDHVRRGLPQADCQGFPSTHLPSSNLFGGKQEFAGTHWPS